MSERIPLVAPARAALDAHRANSLYPAIWQALDAVKDPELPAVSLWELGVLRDVRIDGDELVVVLTPTYLGCPAMDVMVEDARRCLEAAELPPPASAVRVDISLAPAWTTDWLSHRARANLKREGVAPPDSIIECPNCGAQTTEIISQFGSTACRSLVRCLACQEPFDYFKPH